MPTLYHTKPWRDIRSRVLARDANCVLSGIAGACHGSLHVHHLDPVENGGEPLPEESALVTLCNRHHRMVHGFLRRQGDAWKRCRHAHRSREAREQCERKLNQS